jgi:hypothetical protein
LAALAVEIEGYRCGYSVRICMCRCLLHLCRLVCSQSCSGAVRVISGRPPIQRMRRTLRRTGCLQAGGVCSGCEFAQ